MIYLVTGTPGTGKTAFVIDCVLKNKYGIFKDENNNYRPMFAVNLKINDKQLLPIAEISSEDFVAKRLDENFEEGSLIIVDEASEIYPVRASASKLPVHVDGLNTLRHYGLTLILITQSPSMIDIFVRNLVGKHLHIDRKQLGSKLYEWNKCVTSPGKTYFAEAYSEMYSPNKKVFGLYESATKHIKFKKSVSWHYKAIPFLFAFLIFMVWYFFQSFSGLSESVTEQDKGNDVELSNLNNSFLETSYSPKNYQNKNLTGTEEKDYIERIRNRPETAPIYDSVRKVVDFPRVVGCIKKEVDNSPDLFSCNSYDQQGNPARVDVKYCLKFIDKRPFDMYTSASFLERDGFRQIQPKNDLVN